LVLLVGLKAALQGFRSEYPGIGVRKGKEMRRYLREFGVGREERHE